MKVVIIEDEALTAEDLADNLLKMPEEIEVVKILGSVAESISYFNRNPLPDLLFCDIQLGDGHSFEIFRQVKISIPVIFCTAFNEYALQAFKNNGIDYVLKPFSRKTLKGAIDKFKMLTDNSHGGSVNHENLVEGINSRKINTLLINWKDKIIPIRILDIALFTIDFGLTQLSTFDNRKYYVNYTLDELETICGQEFYRANRQFLINREVVGEIIQYTARKLMLKLKLQENHEVIISKNKVPEFLSWLRTK
jgi:two-component system, LytTR family, response regulator LytT